MARAGSTPCARKGEWTGAIDLAHDPRNPKVLYAATWERSRTPWNFVESGAGSGIWKSVDGGDSWTRLGGGLPTGDKVGRIGLAVAPSNPDVIYASIDNWTELPESAADLGDRPLTARRLQGHVEGGVPAAGSRGDRELHPRQ